MRSTTIKQRYRMNLFFVVFRLFVLLPNLKCKLIHNRCELTCKLIYIKTTAACVYANEQSVLDVILCFTSENYTKTITRLRLGEHWWIFPSNSSRWIFSNVHLAFGEKLLNREVYTPETSCIKGASVHITNMWIKQHCNHKVWEFAKAFSGAKTFRDRQETGPRTAYRKLKLGLRLRL